jgi:ATP-dependent RNA helicase DDX5/DBP2
LLTELLQSGFERPTAIQSQGWPIILSGKNLVGIADTGSGKTLAYLLPAIVHVMEQELVQPGDSPIVLIVVPTRELCMQVEKEGSKFATIWRISTMAVYGGASRSEQLRHYQRGVDIMVATPGRLLDFLSAKDMNLNRVTYLVLDEADKMLDMGFSKAIRQIVSQIRPDRQTLLFSATWPLEVQDLAKKLCLEKPAEVKIGSSDLTVNPNITQFIYVIEEDEKYSYLLSILSKIALDSKTIIFWGTKLGCDELEAKLQKSRCPGIVLHGDKSQDERNAIIRQFKGRVNTLIATDVASRGLHIDNVKTIINYDFPNQIETYVHRIGRTGRAGNTGTAYSFFNKKNFMLAPELIQLLKRANQEIPEELTRYANLADSTKSSHVLNNWKKKETKIESKEEIKQEPSTTNDAIVDQVLARDKSKFKIEVPTKSLNEVSASLIKGTILSLQIGSKSLLNNFYR